jgi:hypothetical protein
MADPTRRGLAASLAALPLLAVMPTALQARSANLLPVTPEEKSLLAATHMPFPGVERNVEARHSPKWLAADWSYVN